MATGKGKNQEYRKVLGRLGFTDARTALIRDLPGADPDGLQRKVRLEHWEAGRVWVRPSLARYAAWAAVEFTDIDAGRQEWSLYTRWQDEGEGDVGSWNLDRRKNWSYQVIPQALEVCRAVRPWGNSPDGDGWARLTVQCVFSGPVQKMVAHPSAQIDYRPAEGGWLMATLQPTPGDPAAATLRGLVEETARTRNAFDLLAWGASWHEKFGELLSRVQSELPEADVPPEEQEAARGDAAAVVGLLEYGR
jgi:hypothetical protein